MDIPVMQKEETAKEDCTLQTKNKLDDNTTATRKRKRPSKSSVKPQKPVAAEEQVDTDSDDDDAASVKVHVSNQRARRFDYFQAAVDNLINYHIEMEQAGEDRVIILRQTMTRIYEILRSCSYYAGAQVFH